MKKYTYIILIVVVSFLIGVFLNSIGTTEIVHQVKMHTGSEIIEWNDQCKESSGYTYVDSSESQITLYCQNNDQSKERSFCTLMEGKIKSNFPTLCYKEIK